MAAVLLLLPVLYVGSYFALVVPEGYLREASVQVTEPTPEMFFLKHYRFGGKVAARAYWPLEQIDRRLRPGAWEPTWKLGGSGGVRSMKSAYGLGQDPAP
jgi:hypothetical protein